MPLSPAPRGTRVARTRRPIRLIPQRDKRDALLRAATQVFARRGFFNAQVADIARVAGVAAGTVYLYFRNKEDLLTSIFERTMREAIDEGRAALPGIPDPVDRLREIGRLHLDRLGRDRDLAIVFQVELRQSTKHMQRFSSTLLQEYLGMIRDTIADGQGHRSFRTDIHPTTAAKIFFGGLDEMATNWILSRRRYSLVSEAETVVELFVNGVKACEQSRDRGSEVRETNTGVVAPEPGSPRHRKRQA